MQFKRFNPLHREYFEDTSAVHSPLCAALAALYFLFGGGGGGSPEIYFEASTFSYAYAIAHGFAWMFRVSPTELPRRPSLIVAFAICVHWL